MRNKIRLYGFESCPYCKELMGLYDKNELEYDYVDIDLDVYKKEVEQIMKLANSESVPIILVNKTLLSPEISFKSIDEALELTKKFLSES